jgi:hypothetical protein
LVVILNYASGGLRAFQFTAWLAFLGVLETAAAAAPMTAAPSTEERFFLELLVRKNVIPAFAGKVIDESCKVSLLGTFNRCKNIGAGAERFTCFNSVANHRGIVLIET